jgi:uncharacterized sulfatase
MVEWFDETCGQLIDYLDKEGLSENTLVLYVTDNGWVQTPDKPGPLRSKLTPYEAGLRTPIMIRWPGHVQPRTSDELAMSIDLVPTVLAALGTQPSPEMQGVNLLDEQAVRHRKVIFGECFVHTAADLDDPAKNVLWRWMIEGRWKLIVPAKPGQTCELYDLAADRGEKHNLAEDKPDKPGLVKEMLGKVDAWWKPER